MQHSTRQRVLVRISVWWERNFFLAQLSALTLPSVNSPQHWPLPQQGCVLLWTQAEGAENSLKETLPGMG